MKIVYFAWLKERTGVAEEVVDPPADVHTVGDLMVWLGTRGPGYALAFARPAAIRAAVNLQYRKADAPVAATDEVAFFPPVTGG